MSALAAILYCESSPSLCWERTMKWGVNGYWSRWTPEKQSSLSCNPYSNSTWRKKRKQGTRYQENWMVFKVVSWSLDVSLECHLSKHLFPFHEVKWHFHFEGNEEEHKLTSVTRAGCVLTLPAPRVSGLTLPSFPANKTLSQHDCWVPKFSSLPWRPAPLPFLVQLYLSKLNSRTIVLLLKLCNALCIEYSSSEFPLHFELVSII